MPSAYDTILFGGHVDVIHFFSDDLLLVVKDELWKEGNINEEKKIRNKKVKGEKKGEMLLVSR